MDTTYVRRCILIASLKDTHSFGKAGMVSFHAHVCTDFCAGQLSCDQEIYFTKGYKSAMESG